MWKNKDVMITGGAGVIGSHIVEKLFERGATVGCVDIAPRPKWMPNGVRYFRGNLAEINLKESVSFTPNIIFHLAATFERTEEAPGFFNKNFESNVLLTHKIIDFARGCGSLEKFIFASSYLVYSPELYLFDSPQMNPFRLKESDSANPRNLCGAAKYYSEKELEFASKAYRNGFRSISARIFRVYGCGSRDVISRWVRMALEGKELLVFQKENMFDYIYAEDVAEALIKLAEKVENNEIVNVGGGVANRISEVIDTIKREIPGTKIRETGANGFLEASCADISKLLRLIEWKPRITLKEGINKIVSHEKKNLDMM